jgi:hypothetical protein
MSEPIISVENGVEIVLEGAALAEFQEYRENFAAQLETIKAEAEAQSKARASALAKLKKLGLTDKEIAAL